ncbi:c-type cytochrome [Flavobacterium terrigena]|uniref:Cytochrome c n=1 Tax=Flavobacterium terrigena TaxID=402734 RepID=A0A1H6VGJ9_9FLAO|nr:c-type cytochrome [Flavobacterium terrigena]SEJ03779.1 cytochrome c [Flavobacterium terrigena]
MKNFKKLLYLAVLTLGFVSCGEKKETDPMGNPIEETKTTTKALSSEELGKELFEGKGMCFTCHKEDTKIIGPSIKEIAKIYTDKKASISIFLQGETDPIVDPAQFEIMKANFAITKEMTDEELKALEEYMLSYK